MVPLCVDLVPAEVTGPLEAFQGRQLEEEGMRRLVEDLMALRDSPPTPAQTQTDQLFKAMWPLLESQVSEAKQQSPDLQGARRSNEDMLEELVERVRRLDRSQSRDVSGVASVGFATTATDEAKASDYVGPRRAARFVRGKPASSPSRPPPDPS